MSRFATVLQLVVTCGLKEWIILVLSVGIYLNPTTVCLPTEKRHTKYVFFFLICVQVAHHLQHIIVLIHNDMLMNYRPVQTVLFELKPYNLKFVCIV